MRKIRNQSLHSNNPHILVFRGLEQVGHYPSRVKPLIKPESKYDDEELRAMQRAPDRKTWQENLYSLLLQKLVWKNG